MQRGGFRLRKLILNEKDAMKLVSVAERAKSFQTVSLNNNINE